jgi:hypothetical protein
MFCMRGLALLLAVVAGFSDVAVGQGVKMVPSDAACPTCEIRLVRVATMGDADGPGMVHQQGHLTRDSRGRFYLTSNGDPATIRLFDPAGRFLQMIGRRGRGPGEWTNVPMVTVLPGDSLLVQEPPSRRATLLDPAFRPTGTFVLPTFAMYTVVLGDGRVVMSAQDRTGRVSPLTLVDRTGKVIRGFGEGEAPTVPGTIMTKFRVVGEASERGSVWSARMTEYLVERFDSTGARTMALRRQADWFPPGGTHAGTLGVDRQPPTIFALFERGDSLWVFSRVDDLDWQPRPPVPYMGNEDMKYTPDSYRDLLFDTIVEVIDVRSGRLILSQRLRPNLVSVTPDGHVFTYEEDGDGNPRYVAWRLAMNTRR